MHPTIGIIWQTKIRTTSADIKIMNLVLWDVFVVNLDIVISIGTSLFMFDTKGVHKLMYDRSVKAVVCTNVDVLLSPV